MQWIYLDELGDSSQLPLGMSLLQLPIASDEQMIEQARQLIDRVQQEEVAPLTGSEIIEVITTIAVYKFSQFSREQVEAMLGRNIEETRIYQDLERQAILKVAAKLLRRGYSVEKVAEDLELSLEEAQQIAAQQI